MNSDFFALSRTFFVFGELQGKNLIPSKDMNMDEIEGICLKIAEDWHSEIDIRNNEEQAYPGPYARRRILEYFLRSSKE